MMPEPQQTIQYVDVNESLRTRLEREWGETAARHMHLTNGFSIAALSGESLVGLISTYWEKLPAPLDHDSDAYIDILEVHEDYRRQGIARRLIELSIERARGRGMRQIRAWSSEDKVEAIYMWKTLGFGLCPSTTYPGGREVRGFFVVKTL